MTPLKYIRQLQNWILQIAIFSLLYISVLFLIKVI